MCKLTRAVVALAVLCLTRSAPADTRPGESLRADVVVYGDASGGVTAAVQAARLGKSVILVAPIGHLGGMTSSGLGWTDIGDASILGGLCREFYHRVYEHYQTDEAWTVEPRDAYANHGQGVPALDPQTELASTFEPKVSEAVFDRLVAEAGVRVVEGRLDLGAGVHKQGRRLTTLVLDDGRQVAGSVFIDASYEGDLLAAAGVSHTVGRESNAQYGETANGVTGPQPGNQLPDGIDPYLVPGDPCSGLLPFVNAGLEGPVGAGDDRVQAYCYRMVLTDAPANRVAIEKPANYSEAEYELLFRAIEAGQTSRFFKADWMPNRKTDSNNASGISCDWIGGNYGPGWDWTTLDYAEREQQQADHRDWQLGLLWTLQNHPRVPEAVRRGMARWGLPRDEFADNGHWPYGLYIRELRRMVSDFVMTEHHCRGDQPVPDPIGKGAYTLDSHNVQRYIEDGHVKNEGDMQSRLSGPYGISYRAITPRASECDNLLVPWSLSATHIAFGSIRMEPVFMVLGQSAGAAASLAIDGDSTVQAVPYDRLREVLVQEGQRLE